MKAIIGSNAFSYVVKSYIENTHGVKLSVVGKASQGPIKFSFWANGLEDQDTIRDGLSFSKIPYEEYAFPTAALVDDTLVTEKDIQVEDRFFNKTNSHIPFLGLDVTNFAIETPDLSEWFLGPVDRITQKDEKQWKLTILGIDLDTDYLGATIPLSVLSRMLNKKVKIDRLYVIRKPEVPPFDAASPFFVIWDTNDNDTFRWVKHNRTWYREIFSKERPSNRAILVPRHPLRMSSFHGVDLFGPYAQWDPKAGLASILRRLKNSEAFSV